MKYKKIDRQGLIRIAFLGCGYATRIHSRTLSRFDNIFLYFASTDLEKAQKYNKKYYGKGAYGSYDEILEEPSIDVILIATPPVNHLELTLNALNAGKHVIVEKPPFLKSTDFDIVKKAQEQSGTQVLVAENYFYKPLAKQLRKIIASGLIEEPLFLFVNATKTQKTGDWRDDLSLAGGGALFEGGIHWVNFMANLGPEVEEIKGFQPGSKKDIERSYHITFKYTDGPVGTLIYSWEVNTALKGLRLSKIYGTGGSITFESNGVFIIVRGKKNRFIWPGLTDISGYKGMFRDFFKALRLGKDPQFTFDLARRDIELIEKVY